MNPSSQNGYKLLDKKITTEDQKILCREYKAHVSVPGQFMRQQNSWKKSCKAEICHFRFFGVDHAIWGPEIVCL